MAKIKVKTPKEIELIRDAGALAAVTLLRAGEMVKPGVATIEIDGFIGEFTKKNGGISACLGYHGYPRNACISINDVVCHGIPSKDIILKDAWGDGIYINNGTNITTQNILCDNNRRQGVSIIKVDGYHSLNDKIINTNGTSPEYAIDIEPNSNTDYIKNVVIVNIFYCIF